MNDATTRLTHEREITEPVSLTRPDGTLNPDAVGWMRRALLNTSGIGRGRTGRGRNKRWEYWGITTPDVIAAVTVATLDYATLSQVWVLDRRSLADVDQVAITPLSRGVTLPGSLGEGPATATVPGIEVVIAEEPGPADAAADGTRIRATTARVKIDVVAERPAGHEAMGVVVPWNDRRFQYTVKDVARPARGTITIDGVEHELPAGESWAVLDHGRGRWPYRMNWHWGAASGREHGRAVGLQLGGLWTVGTGSTENALSIDGRLHKLGGELEWRYDAADWLRPWSITGERVDLRFEPFHDRSSKTALGVIHSETHQCFGTYRGVVTDDSGEVIAIEALTGWAEYVRQRW
ncbi:DUF2804 domain-containing protein [Agromyces sp. SYSU K20354]|uniref:DUF2804 domain-containing protein n=1 Tax=Agromyces cavernae TaxID=2898659 RepID=UPI001E5C342A|nr:DUF2804 domain-containing protein [Agromyces cavernae]MCD2440718.1 DUF2804 domain-containing protein [Agromyces cavernae]